MFFEGPLLFQVGYYQLEMPVRGPSGNGEKFHTRQVTDCPPDAIPLVSMRCHMAPCAPGALVKMQVVI